DYGHQGQAMALASGGDGEQLAVGVAGHAGRSALSARTKVGEYTPGARPVHLRRQMASLQLRRNLPIMPVRTLKDAAHDRYRRRTTGRAGPTATPLGGPGSRALPAAAPGAAGGRPPHRAAPAAFRPAWPGR